MKREPDYLDELVAETIKEDPEYEHEWSRVVQSAELAGMRVRAGLTQAQVAERMGVRRERVAHIEANPDKTSFEALQKYISSIGGQLRIIGPSEVQTQQARKGRPISSKRHRKTA